MTTPLVSAIIPTYNRAELLTRAVRSVLLQDLKDFELIIVDDASTDETKQVVCGFGDKRIQYIQHRVNRGGAAARNSGAEIARGEYFAFLDSDDEWLQTKLSKQVSLIRSGQGRVGLVGTHYRVFYDNGTPSEDICGRLRGYIFPHALNQGNGVGISGSTPLVTRQAFEKINGFDERLPCRQDTDFWIHISKHFDVEMVPEVLVHKYHYGSFDRIGHNVSDRAFATDLMIEKYRLDLENVPSALGRWLTSAGIAHARNGDYRSAVGRLWKAGVVNPYSYKGWCRLILMLFSPKTYLRIISLRKRK